jgi:pimeloyl-ACP methyl ester carboxylesterase
MNDNNSGQYQTHDVPVAGGRLRVAQWGGSGPLVLCAHGITASHMEFQWLAAELGGEVRLVAPDLRGRGHSNGISGPWGMAAHAADLAAVLDHLGARRADVLLGHSMGGFVAAVTAAQHPDRVGAVLMVDGGVPLMDIAFIGYLPFSNWLTEKIVHKLIGPSLARLDMSFASREEYHAFWRPHPAMKNDWSPYFERYLDYDLEGAPPRLRARAQGAADRRCAHAAGGAPGAAGAEADPLPGALPARRARHGGLQQRHRAGRQPLHDPDVRARREGGGRRGAPAAGPVRLARVRRRTAPAWMLAALLAAPAHADHASGHSAPQGPAKVRFPADFPALVDHEWGFAIGGFGGTRRGDPPGRVPVIFVHGNNVDHADWYPVRDDFRAAGWSDQALWALSYNGLGANNGSALFRANPERDAEHREMGHDGVSRVTSNDVNVPDLRDFILAVRVYTGSPRFSIVAHSLGVTLARKVLKVHPELRADLVAFVGIAGANHGTTFCPPGSEGQVNSCDEIALGTAWLAELNGADGSDETYPPARWLTVYDGSGAGDPAFVGPAYAQSPRLEGADNREYPLTYHNDLRLDPAIVADYRVFLEEAQAAPAPPAAPTLGGAAPAWLLLALALLLPLRRKRVRSFFFPERDAVV